MTTNEINYNIKSLESEIRELTLETVKMSYYDVEAAKRKLEFMVKDVNRLKKELSERQRRTQER